MLQNRLYVGEVSHKGKIYSGRHDAIVDREMFDAAQSALEKGRVEQRLGGGTPDPSLLAGLLWDGHGRRMSPSHATKGNRRYRYYNSRTDDVEARSNPVWRISAPDIETRMIEVVADALEAACRSCTDAGSASATQIERMQSNASSAINSLGSGSGREQRRLIADLVSRIDLYQDQMLISLAFASIDPLLEERGSVSAVPISCVRSSKQLKLVINPVPAADNIDKNPALIKLVTQATAAREAFSRCPSNDFDEIATAIGYGREHAADLLRIGYLAPDIISAILDGRQPSELNRSKLIRWAVLPLCWQQQRIALGFS